MGLQRGEEPVARPQHVRLGTCRASWGKAPSTTSETREKRTARPDCAGRNLVARLACKDDAAEISHLVEDFLSKDAACCDAHQPVSPPANGADVGSHGCRAECKKEFLASLGFVFSAGEINAIEDLIDESYQCVLAEDCHGKVAGFAALSHSPKILQDEACGDEETISLYLSQWPELFARTYMTHRDTGITKMLQPCAPAPTQASSLCSMDPTANASSGTAVLPTSQHSKASADDSVASVNASNTLWINFLVCRGVDDAALHCIIEAMFASAYELEHILMFKRRAALTLSSSPPLFELLDPLAHPTVEAQRTAPEVERRLPPVYHCRRTAWEPPLQVRVAEVEDYDDVVKIFDEQTELRSKDYGEFYLAELVGGQDEGNKCLIGKADGVAVGLSGFTTDVDINLLYNCFNVEKHNFFVKPEYLERIQTTRKLLTHRRQLSSSLIGSCGAGHQGVAGAVGDILQETLSTIPGGVERLLASVTLNEEGLMSVSALIHALKKGVHTLADAPSLVDLKEAIILIICQVHFTLTNLRSSVALPPALITSALQMFTEIDCMQRQQLATFLLEKWDVLLTVFSAPAQTATVPPRDHAMTQRQARMSISVSTHLASASFGGRRRTLWSSVDKRRSARLDTFFLEGDRDEAEATIKICQLCETLLRRPEFQLKPSEVSTLLLCLHWWAEVPITHPTMEISSEKLKNALQRLSRAAVEYFALTYGTPGWLQKLPVEQKNAFAINIFALDEQRHSQALNLLLPAFSLFEDKEYCLLLQPPTAPLLPFMRYFCAEEKNLGSLLNQVLFVLHRQSLLTTPLFRYLRSAEVEEAAARARAGGVRLSSSAVAHARSDRQLSRNQSHADFYGAEPSQSSVNTGEETKSEKTDSADDTSQASSVDCSEERKNNFPTTRFAVVGHACGQIVAVAEVQLASESQLCDMMLTSNLEPYLLHEQLKTQRRLRDILEQRRRQCETKKKLRRLVFTPPEEIEEDEQLDAKLRFDAYGGHAVLHFCVIDPVFQYFERIFLREIMRLTGARLLHILTEHPKMPPAAFRIFSPVKPKGISDARYVEGPCTASTYSRQCGRILSRASPAMQNPTAHQLLSRRHQDFSHLVCKPQFLSNYTFVFHERIVAVGFSSTTYAFLKTLLFANRSCRFQDITVLAPGGLPKPRQYQELLLSQTGFDLEEAAEIRRLFVQLRVRVIDRRLCGIDRKRKLVYLDAASPNSYEQDWDLYHSSPKGNKDGDLWREENVTENAPTVPYDFLFLTTGLQDASLQEIGVRSWGLNDRLVTCDQRTGPASENGVGGSKRECVERSFRPLARVDGCISSADPRLYDLLDENGPYLVPLRWNPLTLVVVYGRSVDAYCLIHGLLQRRVPPQKITLVLPPKSNLADQVLEFQEDEPMERKSNEVLKSIGVTLLEGYWLRGVLKDRKGVLKFALLDDSNQKMSSQPLSSQQPAPAVVFEEDDAPPQERRSFSEQLVDDWNLDTGPSTSAAKLKPYTPAPTASSSFSSILNKDPQSGKLQSLQCRVLLTADTRKNADHDVFESIHDCGLVYDGRLIVNRDFQTNDSHIYAAGSLCEFSRQYRPTRKTLLEQHKYNGSEMGVYLAASFLKRLNRSLVCPAREADSRDGILDPKLLRPHRENKNPLAAAADVLNMPSAEDIRSYLYGGDLAAANRIDLLPRFGFPLCTQGVLPGGVYFHRLALCAGCLSKFTSWSPERVATGSPDDLSFASRPPHSPNPSILDKRSGHDVSNTKISCAPYPGYEVLRTDTLRLRWSDPVANNTRENKSWRHLIATDGQMCEVGIDKLRRMILFKYLGPACLRLDAFFYLMGMPISFLNMIEKKSRENVMTDIMAFLNEEERWFEALLHPRMPTFLQTQRQWLLHSASLCQHVQEAIEKQAKQICLTESLDDDFYTGVANTVKNHVQAELIDLLDKYQSDLRSFYLPDTSGSKV